MRTFKPPATICVPNWFSKDHAETLSGRKLSRKDWRRIVDEAPDDMADEISEMFSIWLASWLARQDEADAQKERLEGK